MPPLLYLVSLPSGLTSISTICKGNLVYMGFDIIIISNGKLNLDNFFFCIK